MSEKPSELETLYGDVGEEGFSEAFPTKIPNKSGRIYYKIINNPPMGKTPHGEENVGKFIASNNQEIFDEFLATITYMAPQRKLLGKGGKALCGSCGGEFPDSRYKPPRCEEANAEQVGKMLEKYNFDKAAIPGIVSKVTSKDVLNQCAYRTESGKFFELCPSADRRLKTSCKLYIAVFGFDHDRGQEFAITLGGQNTWADKRFVSPLAEFQHYAHKKAVPLFGWQVKICTTQARDGGAYMFKVELQDPPPHQIVDMDLIKHMKRLFGENKESFLTRAVWMPKEKEVKKNSDLEGEDD